MKNGTRRKKERLYHLLETIWMTEVISQDWRDSSIVVIYKRKADSVACSNSRGISLLCFAGKITDFQSTSENTLPKKGPAESSGLRSEGQIPDCLSGSML